MKPGEEYGAGPIHKIKVLMRWITLEKGW